MAETRSPTPEARRLGAGLFKHTLSLPDGRPLYLYNGSSTPLPDLPQAEPRPVPNPQLRYHALRGEWVMVAAARQDRTFKPPAEYCPLCPTKEGKLQTEIPLADFGLAVFENKFPSLAPSTQLPDIAAPSDLAGSAGTCEVIVYSPDHEQTSSSLGPEKFADLVRVWRERSISLLQREDVRHLLIFENRGEEVGVTLHHPHGQIYAYPFVPPYVERELTQVTARGDILGDLLAFDLRDRTRLVLESDHWVVLVPFWARYPFETYVLPRDMRQNLPAVHEAEQSDLGVVLDRLTKAYDRLFDKPMPYVMAIQQAPSLDEGWRNYRMRVEFQPRLRTRAKLKYLAGTEVASGAFAVDALAEEYAARLREALP